MYKRMRPRIGRFRRNRAWQWVTVIIESAKVGYSKYGQRSRNMFRRNKFNRNKPLWNLIYVLLAWVCTLVMFSILIPVFIVNQEGIMLKTWRAYVGASGIGDPSGWQDSSAAAGMSTHGGHNGGVQHAIEFPESSIVVPVYLTEQKQIELVQLEAYVLGVLAAEMPVDFELEALKAQAIAARTYIINRIVKEDYSQVPVEGAWVTDSIVHQAYLPSSQLEQRLQNVDFAKQWHKLTRAVVETAGQVMTYQNEPIQAAYFSTSNGKTENSEEYWSKAIPYLRSVLSPWDQHLSPKYEQVITLPLEDVLAKLGISGVSLTSYIKGSEIAPFSRILAMTEGGRVKTIEIAGQEFSGREIREKLDLPSTHFQMKVVGMHVEITTYGYGHGIGMSQYGAQGMALEGRTAEDILKYYYQGIEITDMEQILTR